MPALGPREALDVVGRLEAALVALERSFAMLDTDSSQAEFARGAATSRADRRAPLTPEEHRRLTQHLEALLEEVRQLADFLASGDLDRDTPKPG